MIKCLLFILATYSKSNIMFVSLFKSNTFIYQGQIVRAVSFLRLGRNAATLLWPALWHCFLSYLPAPVFALMQNYLTCRVLLNISFCTFSLLPLYHFWTICYFTVSSRAYIAMDISIDIVSVLVGKHCYFVYLYACIFYLLLN